MALSVVNNGASLNAQANLNRTNSALSKSLERLSTGLKINRGADGPAGLVISEQQRAQIAGLQTAIANTNKAVSLVQTGEGALNEISSLLTKVRSLALDSANSGVNDTAALAANQAEISNALGTITQIANTTQFGSKKLLDGSAALTASTTVQNIDVTAATGTAAGNYTFNVTTAAKRAYQSAGADYATLSQGTVSSVTATDGAGGAATGTSTVTTSGTYTGITNRTYTVKVATGGTIGTNNIDLDVTDSTTGATKRIRIPSTYSAGDPITDPTLKGLNLNFAAGTLVTNEDYTFTVKGTGTLNLNGYNISLDGNNSATLGQTIDTINSYSGQTGVKAQVDPSNASRLVFVSTSFGTAGNFSITVDAFLKTKLGLSGLTAGTANATSGAANGATAAVNAAGTISNDGGITNTTLVANGNVLSGQGVTITLKDNPGSTTFQSVAPGAGSAISLVDNGLVFQIGANAGQTTSLQFSDVRAGSLAKNVAGNQFSSLSAINVTTSSGAQDTLKLVDQAISDVASLRGKLGAFQTNTLESNANNLQSTLENTKAAESVVRDTDFASEIANFTRLQTQLQAGATVLGNANQTTALVAQLLRG